MCTKLSDSDGRRCRMDYTSFTIVHLYNNYSNFRVLRLTLDGHGGSDSDKHIYKLEKEHMTGNAGMYKHI